MTDIGGNVVMAFDLAGQLLTLLAPSILFVSLIYVSSAILQATGNEKLSIISALSGVTVKLVSSYILLGIPSIGIYGTPISTTLCYLVIIIFNFFFLVRKTGYTPSLKHVFLKPLIASACCGAAALGAHLALSSFLGGKIATLGAIGVAVIVYAAILLAIKGLNRDDVKMLPKGEKLCSLLERFKLI
jgi:stage V sporulation protein B